MRAIALRKTAAVPVPVPAPAPAPAPAAASAAASADDRAVLRQRRARAAFAVSLLAKAVGMLGMVLGVHLTLPYLGTERFGVWMTVASLSTLLSFMDLGIGNALTNRVAQQAAQPQREALRRTISGGLGGLMLLGLLSAALLVAIAAALPWDRLLKGSQAATLAEARTAAMSFGALFGLGMLSTGLHRVFAGLQRAHEAHGAAVLGGLLSLAGLWLCTARQAGVPTLLLVTLGSHLLATLPLLWRLHRQQLFAWRTARQTSRAETGHLLQVGSLFLLLQLGCMLGWGADNLIVASRLGATEAAAYALAQRLMQLVALPLALLNAPLWAAYADAHVRGDAAFIGRTLRRSLANTALLATVGVLTVLWLAEPALALWTGRQVSVPGSLLLSLGLWTVLEATGNAWAMGLNGCGVIRPQVVSALLFCALVAPLKWLFAAHWGTAGVPVATILAYLVAVPLLYATVFRQAMAQPLRPASQH